MFLQIPLYSNRQTSSANRNAVYCGNSQQEIYFWFPKCSTAVNAPEVNILLTFSKLPCAARSAKTIVNYDAARPEYRGIWFLPLVLPPSGLNRHHLAEMMSAIVSFHYKVQKLALMRITGEPSHRMLIEHGVYRTILRSTPRYNNAM